LWISFSTTTFLCTKGSVVGGMFHVKHCPPGGRPRLWKPTRFMTSQWPTLALPHETGRLIRSSGQCWHDGAAPSPTLARPGCPPRTLASTGFKTSAENGQRWRFRARLERVARIAKTLEPGNSFQNEYRSVAKRWHRAAHSRNEPALPAMAQRTRSRTSAS